MAKKWITAKDILAEKGFQPNKFDTEGFNNLIGKFFLEHEVKDTIIVRPARFIEMKDAPACGYINQLDTDIWWQRVRDPNDSFDSCDYIIAMKKGWVHPTIVVDEPFIKNAVYMANLTGGYIVKKGKSGRYVISLV